MKNTAKKRTLCWSCTKPGTGGCSWDKSLTPVEGWTAEETELWITDGYEKNFCVLECPLYEKDPKWSKDMETRQTAEEVKQTMLDLFRKGMSNKTVARLLGVHHWTCQYHRNRFRENGLL